MKRYFILLSTIGLIVFYSCKDKTVTPQESKRQDTVNLNATVQDALGLKQLNDRLKMDPNNPGLYFARAQVYAKIGDHNAAEQDVFKAIAIDSADANFYTLLADIYKKSDRLKKALASMQKAVKLAPNNENAHLRLAQYYLYFPDRHKEAMKEVNDALRINKYNADAYFLKGMIYKDKKETAKAISAFTTAVEQNPDHSQSQMQLALLHTANNNDKALIYYKNLLDIDSLNVQAHYNLAKYYQDKAQYNASIKAYRKLLRLSPQNEQVLYNLGVIYYGLDSLNKAGRSFKLATRIDPTFGEAFTGIALCQERLGNTEQAVLNYRQSLKFRPDYGPAREGLKRVVK